MKIATKSVLPKEWQKKLAAATFIREVDFWQDPNSRMRQYGIFVLYTPGSGDNVRLVKRFPRKRALAVHRELMRMV